MLLGPMHLCDPVENSSTGSSHMWAMDRGEDRCSHSVRSRSCGTLSGAEPTVSSKPETRRKKRRQRDSPQKRRTSCSHEDPSASRHLNSKVETNPSPEPCNISNIVSSNPTPKCSLADSYEKFDSEDSDNCEKCTALATFISEDDDRPFLSATDLSTVYKSLELLNGYLTMQGYSPYDTAILSDPRVTEILSHIQHGCPLARRPSKHLPSIDSTVLPVIDWEATQVPSKTDLSQLLIDRIHTYIHTDIEILIGREIFCCHSLVLQSYSSYFDDVGGASKVHLPEEHVTGRAFHTMYDWMISTSTKSFVLILKRENVIELLNASQFLGVHELEEQCWSFINSNHVFSEESAFLLYLEARKVNNRPVMELMLPKVQKFFLRLVSTVDFLSLDCGALCAVLGSNFIAVHNEMEVFMAAVLWLTYDWSKRRGRVVEVMGQVRFGWLEPWQIVDIRRNYSSNPEFIRVTQNAEVRRMMEEGLAFATTRTACAGDWERLRQLVDSLCLTEPPARHWLAGDVYHSTFHSFIESLPKYRDPDALDMLEFRVVGDNTHSPPAPSPASAPEPPPPPLSYPCAPNSVSGGGSTHKGTSMSSCSTREGSAETVITVLGPGPRITEVMSGTRVAEGKELKEGVEAREEREVRTIEKGESVGTTTRMVDAETVTMETGDGKPPTRVTRKVWSPRVSVPVRSVGSSRSALMGAGSAGDVVEQAVGVVGAEGSTMLAARIRRSATAAVTRLRAAEAMRAAAMARTAAAVAAVVVPATTPTPTTCPPEAPTADRRGEND